MGKDVIVACDFPSKERVIDFLDGFTDRKPFVKSVWNFFMPKDRRLSAK